MKRVTIYILVLLLFVSYINISIAAEESVTSNEQESIRPLQSNQNDLWIEQGRGGPGRGGPGRGGPQQDQTIPQWAQRGNNQNQEQNQEQGQQIDQQEQAIQEQDIQEQEQLQDTNIPDDPNEIKERVNTFDGLQESIEEVSSASRMSTRQWRLIENDNRAGLVRAIQRQLENELEFINTIALSEDANETMQICSTMSETRKEQSRIVLLNLNQQSREEQRANRTTRTTNRTQRTTGRTSRTQNINTQQDNTTYDTNMQQSSDEEEPQYDEETQSEIDLWLNSDVTNFDQRSNLAQTVNDKIRQDFNSIRTIALEEEANKTVAAIDGLFIARLERYAEVEEQNQRARERLEAQQETSGNTTGNTSTRRRR